MFTDIKFYTYHTQILEMQKLANNVIDKLSWKNIIEDLRKKNPNTQNKKDTWYLMLKNKDESFINTSTDGLDTLSDIDENMDVSWIFLKIFDNELSIKNKDLFHSSLSDYLENFNQIFNTMDGVINSGFHFVFKNTKVPPHNDYEESKWYHILIVLGKDTEDVTLFLSNCSVPLKNQDIIVFDAKYDHYLENRSNKDFICLVLQVESQFFKA